MITGTTNSGFAFEIEEETLDDYELLESLSKVDKGEVLSIAETVDRLLGEEQKDRLKEHIRNVQGRITIAAMMDEVVQIFNASGEIKNS